MTKELFPGFGIRRPQSVTPDPVGIVETRGALRTDLCPECHIPLKSKGCEKVCPRCGYKMPAGPMCD